MIDQLKELEIPFFQLEYSRLRNILSKICKSKRTESNNTIFIGIFLANELDHHINVISHCGFQKDILSNISNGNLSFNKAWSSEISTETFQKLELSPHQNQLSRQLDIIFKNHNPNRYFLTIVKCSLHEYIVFIEVNHHAECPMFFFNIPQTDILRISEALFFAHLKSYKDTHISDWEKAVHELASPLDFIYSNANFLLYYLRRTDLNEYQKEKKIKDLILIADLLLKRLHQFRFAFAGTSTIKTSYNNVCLLDIFMPITHLWYHESGSKGIHFNYDDLRNINVITDSEIVQFIGFNLISNAIKYSHRGKLITLYARIETPRMFVFGVKNIGIPILNDEIDKIFELGYRTDLAQKTDARGLGVGLNVCRNLANELGGKISLVDGSGNPTIFEVELPIQKMEK